MKLACNSQWIGRELGSQAWLRRRQGPFGTRALCFLLEHEVTFCGTDQGKEYFQELMGFSLVR